MPIIHNLTFKIEHHNDVSYSSSYKILIQKEETIQLKSLLKIKLKTHFISPRISHSQ